jgi:hypothetical protein
MLKRFRRRRTTKLTFPGGMEWEAEWEAEWETLPNGSLGLRKDGKLVGAIELLGEGRTRMHNFEGIDQTGALHLLHKLGEMDRDGAFAPAAPAGHQESSPALTVLELAPSPKEISTQKVGQDGMLTLLATGLVNPFGPTLNALVIDGDPEPGRTLPVLRLMLNPFVQEFEQVGSATIGESWNLAGDLPPFFTSITGSCPSILMPSAMLDDSAALMLAAEFLQLFDDGFELREKVRRHPGDPFNRVQEDVDGLGDMLRQFTGGEELADTKRRLTPDEARELATTLLDQDNLKKELGAFFYAWKGSIDFQSGSIASEALTLEDFAGWFSLIAPSCRMPDLEG